MSDFYFEGLVMHLIMHQFQLIFEIFIQSMLKMGTGDRIVTWVKPSFPELVENVLLLKYLLIESSSIQ